ncbi:hypothetical protein ACJX0J_026398 [Zea mays]
MTVKIRGMAATKLFMEGQILMRIAFFMWVYIKVAAAKKSIRQSMLKIFPSAEKRNLVVAEISSHDLVFSFALTATIHLFFAWIIFLLRTRYSASGFWDQIDAYHWKCCLFIPMNITVIVWTDTGQTVHYAIGTVIWGKQCHTYALVSLFQNLSQSCYLYNWLTILYAPMILTYTIKSYALGPLFFT